MEDDDGLFVYGIPIPKIEEGVQPLECLILIKGIRMDDGSPTMTSIGSNGMTPWEAVGMMQIECERIKFQSVYAAIDMNAEDDD